MVAPHLRAGDLVILSGDLGAGKTTFTQGLGEALHVKGSIASPTFIIARTHAPAGDGPGLIHVDAYRLNSLKELDDLDLDSDVEECVTVVEWGDGKAEALAADRLHVSIDRDRHSEWDPDRPHGGPRTVRLSAVGQRWQRVAFGSLPGHGLTP